MLSRLEHGQAYGEARVAPGPLSYLSAHYTDYESFFFFFCGTHLRSFLRSLLSTAGPRQFTGKKVGVCCSLVFRQRRRRRRAQRSVLDGRLEGRLGAGEVSAGCGRRRRCREISPDHPVYPGQYASSLPVNSALALISLLVRKHGERAREVGGGRHGNPASGYRGLFSSPRLCRGLQLLTEGLLVDVRVRCGSLDLRIKRGRTAVTLTRRFPRDPLPLCSL